MTVKELAAILSDVNGDTEVLVVIPVGDEHHKARQIDGVIVGFGGELEIQIFPPEPLAVLAAQSIR